MGKRDYYEVLAVDKSADEKSIKKSYKRLAMKFHPDRNKDASAEGKFKEIQEAYSVLSDSSKKQAYDQFGFDGVNAGAGGFGGGKNPFGSAGAGGFGDIFSDIFGGGNSKQQNNRGDDLQYNLEITLKQAVFGDTVKVRITKDEKCTTCKGSGAKAGSGAKNCATCGGHGQVQMQQGFFSVQSTCPKCRGKGKVIDNPCKDCNGRGLQRRPKTLSVKIPAGVDNGNRIRLNGEGGAGANNGANGDLYVEIRIKAHNIFSREGNNLLVTVPVDFPTVTLGGVIEVPTLNGKLKIKIPTGTQTDKLFRLKGKGVPMLRGGGVGDLFAKIKIETPVNLNNKQKELLQKFAESCGIKQHPQGNSFFDKMKSFFD